MSHGSIDLVKYLHAHGSRMTPQRQLILDAICAGNGTATLDIIFHHIHAQAPALNLATVYRNLKLFKELGLVAENNLGETHSHYEMRDKAEHHHLVCLGCGRIIEFKSPFIAKAAAKTQRENAFDITSVQLKIEGYCRKCQKFKK